MTDLRPGRLFLPVSRTDVIRRFPRLLLGLWVFGSGTALQVRSGLGLSPWAVLHQGISVRTPLTIGVATIVVSFLVLLLWIPLRQRLGVGTVANALVIGTAIDTTLTAVPEPGGRLAEWTLLLGGILLVGIGSGLYIGARLGPGPRDGLMTGIAERGYSLRGARTAIEGSALVVGWMLGGVVGIGTLVFAVTIGPLVQFFLAHLAIPEPVPDGLPPA